MLKQLQPNLFLVPQVVLELTVVKCEPLPGFYALLLNMRELSWSVPKYMPTGVLCLIKLPDSPELFLKKNYSAVFGRLTVLELYMLRPQTNCLCKNFALVMLSRWAPQSTKQ